MRSLRIHYFQHVAFETPGYIETWANMHGHQLTATKWYEEELLPAAEDIDWLILMGGPMGVYESEKYSWLAVEKAYVKQCIDAGKTVLGICLGAQLIASAMGARVYPNAEKEIGWFPVQLTESGKTHKIFADLPSTFTVLHWHGDTFELPAGADHLLQTGICANQAFSIGKRVLALQFHLETTEETLQAMIANCGDELVVSRNVQTAKQLIAGSTEIGSINVLLECVLDRMAGFNKV
jgi:GMP synthase-like glutamine amidotransferase